MALGQCCADAHDYAGLVANLCRPVLCVGIWGHGRTVATSPRRLRSKGSNPEVAAQNDSVLGTVPNEYIVVLRASSADVLALSEKKLVAQEQGL